MTARREITGLWWRPGEPDDRIAGVLRIDEEQRASLELVGSFRDLSELSKPFQVLSSWVLATGA
jgi:hypothetical protein